MKRFEYMVIERAEPMFDAGLSAIGSDGWELRSFQVLRGQSNRFHYVFMRESVNLVPRVDPSVSEPTKPRRKRSKKAAS